MSVEEIYASEGKPKQSSFFSFNNKTIMYVGGLFFSTLIKDERMINASRVCYVSFYVAAWWIFRKTIKNIDDSYTSYKGNVEYGLSNNEKTAARNRARSSIQSISIRGLISAVLHYRTGYLFPLVLSMLTDAFCVFDNEDFRDVLDGKPPRKPNNIPRSPSGRLM